MSTFTVNKMQRVLDKYIPQLTWTIYNNKNCVVADASNKYIDIEVIHWNKFKGLNRWFIEAKYGGNIINADGRYFYSTYVLIIKSIFEKMKIYNNILISLGI